MKYVIFFIFLIVFIVALLFSVLNFHPVQINFGIGSISLPLTIALTIELFAGFFIGLLVAYVKILKLKSEYSQLKKRGN